MANHARLISKPKSLFHRSLIYLDSGFLTVALFEFEIQERLM